MVRLNPMVAHEMAIVCALYCTLFRCYARSRKWVSAIGSASWLPTLETGAVLVNAGDLVAVVKAWRTQQNWTPRNVKENMNRPIDPHVQPVKVVLMLDLCWKTCWVFNPYTKYHDWGYEARFEMGILAANQGFGGPVWPWSIRLREHHHPSSSSSSNIITIGSFPRQHG